MPLPRILFILPHPDDESFPVGGTIARYAHSGAAEVFLYTLTRGEASRNAAALGITREEIAKRRSLEVKEAVRILGIKEHWQGDYPDGKLRDLDPRILEQDFERLVRSLEPSLVITYDVQGGSVHPDHIVTHHAVKRVFVCLREEFAWLRRLACFGIPEERVKHWPRKIFGLSPDRIHAIINVKDFKEYDRSAVMAHVSVRRDVVEHNYDEWMFWDEEYFTFFQESFNPPVEDLLHGL